MKKNKKGFTLVELMAVIIVLIVILLLAFNKIKNSKREAYKKALQANVLSYVKEINNQAGIDVLESARFKNGVFNVNALESYGIKLTGKKPDSALFCVKNYKVENACVQYGEYKITYENDEITKMENGDCNNIGKFSCSIPALKTYTFTGAYETFKAPYTGLYKIDLWGAQGGGTEANPGGKGGYTTGLIELAKGEELYIYVGEKGRSNASVTNSGAFNGGGYSGNNGGSQSYGGGGATDVRISSGAWNDAIGLRNRIMVAGGGGGNVAVASSYSIVPGVGGNLTGGKAAGTYDSNIPTGGTQTGPGSTNTAAKQGVFGAGKQNNESGWGGGGGGGYWGGSMGNGHGGSGGSSYISGYKGSVAVASDSTNAAKDGCANGTTDVQCSIHYSGVRFTHADMKSGKEKMPNPNGEGTIIGNEGDGYAKIYGYNIEDPTSDDSNYVKTYGYTGKSAIFRAPKTGSYKVELWGASGWTSELSGKGAYTSGLINLNKNDFLYVYVGQGNSGAAATFNGGGSCRTYCYPGGGATDVRLVQGEWNNLTSLASRIMVAGGGGGYNTYSSQSSGGYAGGLTGRKGYGRDVDDGPFGGSQTAGGDKNNTNTGDFVGFNGTFGVGGNAGSYGGGGGGGYYGGGGGSNSPSTGGGETGGGGGSSYISGYTGCVAIKSASDITPKEGCSDGTTDNDCSIHYSGYKFTNAVMISGNESMPTFDGQSTMVGNSGNGHAKISFVE